MKKSTLYPILLCSILLYITGCKTAQLTPSISKEKKEAQQLFENNIEKNKSFKYLTAKSEIVILSNNKEIKSKANIRITKDSLIQISLQPMLGIELFKIHITTDSLFFVDKMNKRIVKEAFSTLATYFPQENTFTILQSILLNQVFLSNKKNIIPKDFTSFTTTPLPQHSFAYSNKSQSLQYRFEINKEELLQNTTLIMDNLFELNIHYTQFQEEGKHLFPLKITLNTPQKEAEIAINYLSLDWGTKTNPQFSYPLYYKEISLQEILKSLLL